MSRCAALSVEKFFFKKTNIFFPIMYYKFLIIFLFKISTILATSDKSTSDIGNREDSSVGLQNASDSGIVGASKFENSIANNEYEDGSDLKSLICSTFPGTCSRLASLTRQLFPFGAFEGRGPKDLVAIMATMLATLLGAILVKLNVLIALSLLSVGIGKIIVLLLTLKSHLFAAKTQPPVVYEKIYYPNHREYVHVNQPPQTYHDDYSSYNLSN